MKYILHCFQQICRPSNAYSRQTARRGRKLGVLGKLENLGESVFRGFQLRVVHFALYPKRKTRGWKPRSALSSLFTKLRVFHFALYPKRKTQRWKPRSALSSLFTKLRVFPTPSFPFCTVPKTENSEFSLRFTRTAIFFNYLIKLRGFPTPSFPFCATLKTENSEMENLGVWSDGVRENSEVFFSEFSVLSVVQNGKVGVGKPGSLTKVPQSLMKLPQSKSPRFSTPTFRFWV